MVAEVLQSLDLNSPQIPGHQGVALLEGCGTLRRRSLVGGDIEALAPSLSIFALTAMRMASSATPSIMKFCLPPEAKEPVDHG